MGTKRVMDRARNIDKAFTEAWGKRGKTDEGEEGMRGTWRTGKATCEGCLSEEYVENP